MSTVETIQRELLDRMLRGELEPGKRLRQDALAEELGVSKIPVREALHRLAARGLVTFESNRGAAIPALTAADAEENFTLRQAIEPQLLRRAIPNLTIVDLAEAELALDDEAPSVAEANWVFHRSLYGPSGWERGLAITEILHAGVAPYVDLYDVYLDTAERAGHSDEQHWQLLAACRSGNVAEAIDVLDAHLIEARDALVGFLSDTEEN